MGKYDGSYKLVTPFLTFHVGLCSASEDLKTKKTFDCPSVREYDDSNNSQTISINIAVIVL